MYPYVMFDLDGTLLNTIDDLANAGNYVCQSRGWPTHPVEAYKKMVGNGLRVLLERFAPQNTPVEELDEAFAQFKAYYARHKEDQTAPYAGMPQLVARIQEKGVAVAVLTNKAHDMARAVVDHYYPGLIPTVQGAVEGAPHKPDPTLLLRLMEQLGASRENTLFVGDSNVDMQTARNGGLTSCGVLWGFRSREELEGEGAAFLVQTPEELEALILGGDRR